MPFTELLKMAALSLVANKLRTLLTMLGIIIGKDAAYLTLLFYWAHASEFNRKTDILTSKR